MLKAKKQGLVKHVGLSTHNAKLAKHVQSIKEIEVILATINERGYEVHGGSVNDMKKALKKCHDNGKAVYAMKVFAAGRIKDFKKAIRYVKALDFIDVLCLGVKTVKELEQDASCF